MAFHVPEQFRIRNGALATGQANGNNGAFRFLLKSGLAVRCLASDGAAWDHVSVSVSRNGTVNRCPTWEEMCAVKALFWDDEDCVVQLHPPASEYVNCHPFTLHLWRDQANGHRTPPAWMVGPKS